MLFQRIESPGLAHFSYLVGDQGEAVVIDPRRDCQVYVELTSRNDYELKYILETHRNEDYIVGSTELAAKTDAEIWHADTQLDYGYGSGVEDGQEWSVGRLKLKAIHTPGHTLGSMSYLLHDPSGEPWMVFTGDALFAGDVGRVDFMGQDRLEEMAGHLYNSVFGKLLPLGDQVILCPAHGAGSACGSEIADRPWTTLGLEKQLNPKLQHTNEDEFIKATANMLEYPPYFERMEEYNLEGPPLLNSLPAPTPLSPRDFRQETSERPIVDIRKDLAFSSAHVDGALSIWLGGLSSFAGWYLPYDEPLLLVGSTDRIETAVRQLVRLGYDDIAGYLRGGMLGWHSAGLSSSSIATLTVQKLCRLLDAGEEPWILDVRKEDELAENGRITEAHNLHLTQLPDRKNEVPKDEPVFTFCGSGLRAMIAASWLAREGWDNMNVVLGGLMAWNSRTCPLQ